MQITLVTLDDWQGLYLDGILEYEGHSIPDFEWMRVLNQEENMFDVDQEWVEVNGLPEYLGDIPHEVRL